MLEEEGTSKLGREGMKMGSERDTSPLATETLRARVGVWRAGDKWEGSDSLEVEVCRLGGSQGGSDSDSSSMLSVPGEERDLELGEESTDDGIIGSGLVRRPSSTSSGVGGDRKPPGRGTE